MNEQSKADMVAPTPGSGQAGAIEVAPESTVIEPIFVVSVPATMSTSACRGLARNGNMPKRSMSFTLVAVLIISMAQQLRPERSGHSEFARIRSRM